MWYEVIRVPGVTERESGSEPAEHKCEAGLKSRLCGYDLGNARADPELTQISRFPLQLFPSDPR